jgi:putative folate metabolism gamma-glutamate ligase
MIVTAYKTPKIVVGSDLFATLDVCLSKLQKESIVVVTSKIVSICQGRVIKNDGTVDKRKLIRREAQLYMEEENSTKWGIVLTVKNDTLIASSGIDESNGNGYFILWPKNLQKTAAGIWNHLRKKHHVKRSGVIICDSHTTPLRWGVTGIGIGWCGFEPLNNYINTPDIFGRKLHVTKASVMDGLAAAAVAVMGEGNEQTPLAVITDVPFVRFTDRPPTPSEIKALHISMTEDIFSPLVNSPLWKKGGQKLR